MSLFNDRTGIIYTSRTESVSLLFLHKFNVTLNFFIGSVFICLILYSKKRLFGLNSCINSVHSTTLYTCLDYDSSIR